MCLKQLFSPTLILVTPEPLNQFIVEVDTSDVGLGAILSQCSPCDNKIHPCSFLSHRLSPKERNYDMGDCKLLAIRLALSFRLLYDPTTETLNTFVQLKYWMCVKLWSLFCPFCFNYFFQTWFKEPYTRRAFLTIWILWGGSLHQAHPALGLCGWGTCLGCWAVSKESARSHYTKGCQEGRQ